MRIGHLVRTLAAGATLYLVMAACGAAESANAPLVDDGGGQLVDAFVDALGDELAQPVKDAKADPLPPDVATEACDKISTSGGQMLAAAVHQYPGKSAADLSMVHAVIRYSAPLYTIDGLGYDLASPSIIVRDGSVAVLCGGTTVNPQPTVTFALAR